MTVEDLAKYTVNLLAEKVLNRSLVYSTGVKHHVHQVIILLIATEQKLYLTTR